LLPECQPAERWELIFDTKEDKPKTIPVLFECNTLYEMETRSLALFKLPMVAPSEPEQSINIMENALRILHRAEQSVTSKGKKLKGT